VLKRELAETVAALRPRRTFVSSGPSWLWGAFMCIHRYEGAWDAATGNGYYGGLQFGWNGVATLRRPLRILREPRDTCSADRCRDRLLARRRVQPVAADRTDVL
jgi:hypothetical protein